MNEWNEWLLNSCPDCDGSQERVMLYCRTESEGTVCYCKECGGEWTGLKYRKTLSKPSDL